jgi:RNA polymerase sigma factor (sigma-70 family)
LAPGDGTGGAACPPAAGATAGAEATAGVTALYQAHAVGLIRLAIVMLGDRAAAEDVAQDTFLGLYRHWEGLADPGKALAYVRSAVLNRCRDAPRQRGRPGHQAAGHQEAGAASESAEAAVVVGEEHQRVLAAVRALPGRPCEALVLRFYLDMSEEEAAPRDGDQPRHGEAGHVPRGRRARPDPEGGRVSGTEDRARAAMRGDRGHRRRRATTRARGRPRCRDRPGQGIALPQDAAAQDEIRPGGRGRDRRRRWPVLAPVAAAVAIVAVAVALVIIRSIPNGSVATPPTLMPTRVVYTLAGLPGVPEANAGAEALRACLRTGALFPSPSYAMVLAQGLCDAGRAGAAGHPGADPVGAVAGRARLGEQPARRAFELDALRDDVPLCEDGTRPQLRVTALLQAGTMRWLAAAVGGYHDGENALADKLEGALRPGQLSLADRGFFSMDRWTRFFSTGAHLLWRVKNGAKSVPFRRLETLKDGSELVLLRESVGIRGKRRRDVGDRALPRHPDTVARFVCFTILTRPGAAGRRRPRSAS